MRLPVLSALLIVTLAAVSTPALPQYQITETKQARPVKKPRNLAMRCKEEVFAKANPRSCARYASANKPAEPAKQPEQLTRPDFTAEDQAAAIIPGIPDAR